MKRDCYLFLSLFAAALFDARHASARFDGYAGGSTRKAAVKTVLGRRAPPDPLRSTA